MPKDNRKYPAYFKNHGSIVAIASPTVCFVVSQGGSNINDGVCLDKYITRKMVLRYYDGEQITREAFISLYNKIFNTYLNHII